MNIKIVKEPVPKYPGCQASYNHRTKSILIKKYIRREKRQKLIIHEYGHYLIDMIFIFPKIKHYINFAWECIWIVLFTKSDKKADIIWYYQYYSKYAKQKKWVY